MKTLIPTLAIMGVIAPALSQQLLDNGKQVRFGQKLEDVCVLVGKNPVNNPSPVARKGIDKQIILEGVTLSFDSGRLDDIEFSDGYQFRNPPSPYADTWKNFEPIEGKRIRRHMPRPEFLAYLALWEDRAKALGRTKTDLDDLAAGQYCLSFTTNEFMDMINISFGPTRSTGKGGLWADGWSAFFATESDHKFTGQQVGALTSLSAFNDEFNTNARKGANDGGPANGSQPVSSDTNSTPAAAGSRR